MQEQPNLPTVLGSLRKRIEEASLQRAKALYVSARTDRGVHALENYATFYLRRPLDAKAFIKTVTAHHDDGLFSVSVTEVPINIHARGNSRAKKYRYYVMDGCDPDHLEHPFVWKVVPCLSVSGMQAAALFLEGEMDFSSLRGGGCQARSPLKNMHRITVTRCQTGVISIEILGNGFLRKMIRNMVGLLVEIGAHLRSPAKVPLIMAEKKRSAAGIMAPAHGLFLVNIDLRI